MQQWLIDELDDDIGKLVLVDGGYNDRRQSFIMPSGQNNYIDKMVCGCESVPQNGEQAIEKLQHATKYLQRTIGMALLYICVFGAVANLVQMKI